MVNNSELTSLPEAPAGAVFNAEEQEKYRKFKEERRGAADYMNLEGEFSKYLEDVYSAPPVDRESLMDECEIVVVGAGFAAYCYGTSYNMQASRMSDFVRKAAMLEVPGIGTDTLA